MAKRFGIVILAAGASTRLGQPKQLLPYHGKTLVEHAAQTALDSGADHVIVVVGAAAEAAAEKLRHLPVNVVFNAEWATGMASSIRTGLEAMAADVDCVLIALCDQPRMTPTLLRDLAHRHFETAAPIVASSYEGITGVPCAFGPEMFPQLLALTGEAGARDLIRSAAKLETVTFTGGIVDIDTPEDAQLLERGIHSATRSPGFNPDSGTD